MNASCEPGSISSNLLSVYEKKFWQNFSEPRAADYFLLNNRWMLLVILVSHLYLVSRISKQRSSSKQPPQLRPLMIVLNGLHFGAYGCGLLVIGYCIDYGLDSWQCNSSSQNTFKHEVFLRIGYALFMMRLLELTTPLIMAVRQKQSQKPFLHALHNAFYLICIYHGLNRYPKEIMYLYPLTDGAKTALRSAYYSLKSPGPSFGQFQGLKNFILYTSLLLTLYGSYHAASMLTLNCDGPRALMAGFLVLGLAESWFIVKKIALPSVDGKQARD